MSLPVGTISVTLSLLTGLAAGYTIAHWRLSSIFAAKADQEIDEMQKHYEEKYEETPSDEEEDEGPSAPQLVMADSPMPEAVVKDDDRVSYHEVVKKNYTTKSEVVDKDELDEDEDEELEEGSPAHVYNKLNPPFVEVTSEVMGLNEYGYEETIYLNYYYHEDLMLDFWGAKVDPKKYIGDIKLPKPEDDESRELCVINHHDRALVNVIIEVRPLPDSLYEKHETYIKERWLELQAAGERRRAREDGEM